MGTSDARRAVQVPESTWRKARILAAAEGVPIHVIVSQAIERLAQEQREDVFNTLKEVK